MKESSSFLKEHKLQREADSFLQKIWLNEMLFTWRWWLLAAVLVIPWIIWWKLVDRKRIFEILTYGFMVMMTAMSFDAFGVEFDFWEYHYQLIPLLDVLIVYDISILAVTYMLVYQYVSSWKTFIVIHIIISLIFSFVAEPVLVILGYYELLKWKFMYSFPIYLAIALVFRWVMGYFKKLSINQG